MDAYTFKWVFSYRWKFKRHAVLAIISLKHTAQEIPMSGCFLHSFIFAEINVSLESFKLVSIFLKLPCNQMGQGCMLTQCIEGDHMEQWCWTYLAALMFISSSYLYRYIHHNTYMSSSLSSIQNLPTFHLYLFSRYSATPLALSLNFKDFTTSRLRTCTSRMRVNSLVSYTRLSCRTKLTFNLCTDITFDSIGVSLCLDYLVQW